MIMIHLDSLRPAVAAGSVLIFQNIYPLSDVYSQRLKMNSYPSFRNLFPQSKTWYCFSLWVLQSEETRRVNKVKYKRDRLFCVYTNLPSTSDIFETQVRSTK